MCTLASWLVTRRQIRTLSKTSYPDAYKTTCNKMSRYAPSLTNARNSPRSSIVSSRQITKQNTMFLNPGLKSLFTAVIGVASAKQIRKCSVKEYDHLTGSTVYSKKLELKKKVFWHQDDRVPNSHTKISSSWIIRSIC